MDKEIWLFGADKNIPEFTAEVKEFVQDFKTSWNTHGAPIHPEVEILEGRFVKVTSHLDGGLVSGCSKDDLIRFIKGLESKLSLALLNRGLIFMEWNSGDIGSVEFKHLKGKIGEKTPVAVYDLSVSKESEFQKKWKLPMESSWLSKSPLIG